MTQVSSEVLQENADDYNIQSVSMETKQKGVLECNCYIFASQYMTFEKKKKFELSLLLQTRP